MAVENGCMGTTAGKPQPRRAERRRSCWRAVCALEEAVGGGVPRRRVSKPEHCLRTPEGRWWWVARRQQCLMPCFASQLLAHARLFSLWRMSMSAQQASQVTPDIDACKNPYRQRPPRRKQTYVGSRFQCAAAGKTYSTRAEGIGSRGSEAGQCTCSIVPAKVSSNPMSTCGIQRAVSAVSPPSPLGHARSTGRTTDQPSIRGRVASRATVPAVAVSTCTRSDGTSS